LQQEKNIVFQIVNARNATTATPTTHACLGLSLMQKRLALLFPNTHTLSIEKDAQQFRVTLTIDINPT